MTHPILPTLEELLHPDSQPTHIRTKAITSTEPLDPIHLFNMSWRDKTGQFTYLVLPRALTQTRAQVVVMSGKNFPTGSHKVGPGYSCLREKLVSGEIDVDGSTLVFPSTGNYGIGGAWVGPRIGFKSLVVLPEGMSAERFEKIEAYGASVIATPGTESNVKEIYDKVHELKQDPQYRILNQFEDFGNYRFHYHVTGNSALELAQELKQKGIGNGKIAAFVSAMGSAGTIAAADRIKKEHPASKTVGLEPVQCPTLYNVGYGAHGIEGIGDKHVTWIHNVRNMDALICIDDMDCLKGLQLVQEAPEVLAKELGLNEETLAGLKDFFGISGICNVLGAIKTAHHYDLQEDELVFTVATDSFDRYPSVMRTLDEECGEQTSEEAARRITIFHKPDMGWILEATMDVKLRWHNQKYFTWVEQQGKTVEELDALWEPRFWSEQAEQIADLDAKTLALR